MLEGQVLALVLGGVIIAVDFVLGSKVVLVLGVIAGSQVDAGLDMSDQHWLVGLHHLALHFETDAGVYVIDHPAAVELGIHLGDASQLPLGNRRTDCGAVLVAREGHALLIQMLV